MAQENAQANAEPTPPVTVAVTPPSAPAANPSLQERVEPVVDAKFLDSLNPTQLKDVNKSIRASIPRDERGKALIPAEKTTTVVDTESTPEPVVPEPAPVVEEPAPEVEPEPTAVVPTPVVPTVEPVEPDEPGKLPQHRVRAKDSFDDQVMRRYNNAIRDGAPISMEASIAAEKAAQGILAPAKTETPASKTLEVANQELAALREQRKAAKVAYDEDAADAAQTAIEDKLEEIREIKEDGRNRQQAEQFKRQTAWQDYSNQATTLYPDVLQPASESGKRLLAAKDRLWAEHKASNDPLQFRVDYPLILLKLAAADEGIPPSTVKKPVPVAPKPASTRSVTPAKPAPPLASASARTTPNGTGKPPVAELLPSLNMRDAKAVNKQLSSLLKR